MAEGDAVLLDLVERVRKRPDLVLQLRDFDIGLDGAGGDGR